jgi:hypothetical protein
VFKTIRPTYRSSTSSGPSTTITSSQQSSKKKRHNPNRLDIYFRDFSNYKALVDRQSENVPLTVNVPCTEVQ